MNSSPHTLVDATAIPANRGGVGRYLEHLIPALTEAGGVITVVCQPRDADWMTTSMTGARVIPSRGAGRSRPLRLFWEQLGLPRLARKLGADVIFSPHYTMPLASRIPVVVTLHDATFFSLPEVHSRLKRAFFRTWSRISLARATAAIVPSAATKDELLRWVRPRRDAITVAYHGVDVAVFHAPTAAQVDAARASLAGAPAWIAFLGTIEPRKNVGNLIRAFDAIATTSHPELHLVLAGARGWDDEIDGIAKSAGSVDRIHRLGFVPDSDLAGLLGGSSAFVYPSLGEGFGLPVLEAMAATAPVVTTPFLALPEVGGDVAIYAQPDAGSIADAIRSVLAEDTTERRKRGVARAAEFTWAASAKTHLGVFESAAARKAS